MDRQQRESRCGFTAISFSISVLNVSAFQARSSHQMAGCFMSSLTVREDLKSQVRERSRVKLFGCIQ